MTGRQLSRGALALFYGVAGVVHLANPAPFLKITPGWVPHAPQVIAFTGVCELLGAAGALIPRTRWWAGVMLALYALCVWPANMKHAIDALHGYSGLPPSWLYHGPRLLLQPVIIWWALYACEVTDWPWRRR